MKRKKELKGEVKSAVRKLLFHEQKMNEAKAKGDMKLANYHNLEIKKLEKLKIKKQNLLGKSRYD
jgi:hypothetical protein